MFYEFLFYCVIISIILGVNNWFDMCLTPNNSPYRKVCMHPRKWIKVFETMLSRLCFTDKPHNPMVNAGAIVVTSLIKVKC
jgi:hypothetical protein